MSFETSFFLAVISDSPRTCESTRAYQLSVFVLRKTRAQVCASNGVA